MTDTVFLAQWAVDYIKQQDGYDPHLDICLGEGFKYGLDALLEEVPKSRPLDAGVTILFTTPNTCQAAWFPEVPADLKLPPPSMTSNLLAQFIYDALCEGEAGVAGAVLISWIAREQGKDTINQTLAKGRNAGLRPVLICLTTPACIGVAVVALPAESDMTRYELGATTH